MKNYSQTMTFYVSPAGKDAWSGKLPSPNKKMTDGPFKTVRRAQKAIRALRSAESLPSPVRVFLRKGHHFISSPMVISASECGRSNGEKAGKPRRQESRVVFSGYRKEKAVISGGATVRGWREQTVEGKKLWVASVPSAANGKMSFDQLFVNGERRMRPRLPRTGFYRIEKVPGLKPDDPWSAANDRFGYARDDIKPWRNLQDVEVVVLTFWSDSRMNITRIDEGKRLAFLDRKAGFRLTDDHTMMGAQYYVENIFEELQPGEWYLDRPGGRILYYPLEGEDLRTAHVVVPRLSQLLRVEGTKENPAQGVYFEDLTFSHTEWRRPPDCSSLGQTASSVPAAIAMRNARRSGIRRCIFENIGTYAVECSDGCAEVDVTGNTMIDLGAGGVKILDDCRRITVADNTIGPGGTIFHSASAVVVMKSSDNKVVHNRIHNFRYSAISLGWTWGYAESHSYRNIVEYNHIHDIGQGYLSDLAGIYTLGRQAGSRVRYNIFHDIFARGYGGWAIYLDEGTSDILVENNLAYRTSSTGAGAWGTGGKTWADRGFESRSAPFHQHYGRDNVICNNIFALGTDGMIALSRPENHRSFTFANNIFYCDKGEMFVGNWKDAQADFRKNIYFNAGGQSVRFPGGKTFAAWRKKGMDKGSVIADPRFVNPARGDFSLKKGSPAFKAGFRAFDLSTVGPRARNATGAR